jgi:hypothetical protein
MRTNGSPDVQIRALALVLAFLGPMCARADLETPGLTSDVLGVRSTSNPSSPTANFLDFATSKIVPDVTITEGSASETVTITFSTLGDALPPNDVLHPLRTGTAFLMEPGPPGVVSDMVTLTVNQNFAQFDWTLALNSDPFSFPTGATGFTETGLLQDLSSDLFIASGLITPIDPSIGVQFPFHVVVASDVPEPETRATLLIGIGLLGFLARRRKQKKVVAG